MKLKKNKNGEYLVPLWRRKNYQIERCLAIIEADNEYDARSRALSFHNNGHVNEQWYIDDDYDGYQLENTFTYTNSGAKIKPLHIKEDNNMAYFSVNWNNYTSELANKALKEDWANTTYPNNGILANYIVKTYKKLTAENKVVTGKNYALFNTGLFDKYYNPLYAYQSGSKISFLTGYDLAQMGITKRPERANYFEKPELLLFDWHYTIDVQYGHILDDENNKKRLPKEFLESDNKINMLNGSLDTMKKRVAANYKLAVPQYYEGKIQLLLPLCLTSDDKPDVALAVTKKGNSYQGHTCLTLDMAYNNARLIAKPESNWLVAK